MLERFEKRIRLENKLLQLQLMAVFKTFNPSNNMYIFGDPRGGTTWLMELIRTIPKTTVCWEPLHIGEVNCFKRLGFGFRQYIPDNYEWPEVYEVFLSVFQGKLITEFTTLHTTPSEFWNASTLIVKFCRGTALMPWLVNHFQFNLKPLYLVRHPFSVAASQLQQGGWKFKFQGYTPPSIPFNEVYLKHNNFLYTLKSKEEWLVAQWCIHNLYALRHQNNDSKWITIFYEHLFMDPFHVLERIEQAWGLAFPNRVSDIVNKESLTTKTRLEGKENQLRKWETYFDRQQLMKLTKVLEYFRCEFYSEKTVEPIC